MLLRTPRPLNITRSRLGIATTAVVVLLVSIGSPRALPEGLMLLGAFFGTFAYAPCRRINVAPERAPTLGTIATFTCIGLGLPGLLFIAKSDVGIPSNAVLALLVGVFIIGCVIVADRMRTIERDQHAPPG